MTDFNPWLRTTQLLEDLTHAEDELHAIGIVNSFPLLSSENSVSLEGSERAAKTTTANCVRRADLRNSSTRMQSPPSVPRRLGGLHDRSLERRYLPSTSSPDRDRQLPHPTTPHSPPAENASVLEATDFEATSSLAFKARYQLRPACRLCGFLYLLWLGFAVLSLAVGLWRSFATGDEGKGFTDAAYVIAVGGYVGWALQNWHRKSCDEKARSRRNEGIEMSRLRRNNTLDTV